MSLLSTPIQNHLLAALPIESQQRIFPHLEPALMPLGKVLYESGHSIQHVYFPTDSIVSLLQGMEDGSSAEVAVVGNDGLIGIAVFMGGESTPSRAVVQSAGFAYRLPGYRITEEFNRHEDTVIVSSSLHSISYCPNVTNCGMQPTSYY